MIRYQIIIVVHMVISGVALAQMLQCEHKVHDGDSLILNCTLWSGHINTANGAESAVLISGESATSLQSVNLRVGLDSKWTSPWHSLSINPSIVQTVIWRHSRLSEMGEYTFKELTYLQRVDLSHNKLSHLRSYLFAYSQIDMLELDLSHNFFHTVPHDLFENKRLQRLQILRLNQNPIVRLDRHSFDNIRSNIKTIELNHCKIRSIEADTFAHMGQLDSLSLIGNHLSTLQFDNFKHLNLRVLYVHDNPFNCDCHLRWLIDYLKNMDYEQQQQQQMYEQYLAERETMTVVGAAQRLLKCDQPNSLKSRQNFLLINPDSFMCDIQMGFRDQIDEASYETGSDALLICDVYGDPEPDVYWSYGQKPIGKGLRNVDDKYFVNELRLIPNPRSVTTMYTFTNKTSELRVKNLQPNDFGLYTCTAEIKGSNNRKTIGFRLRQVSGKSVASLSSAATQYFVLVANKILSFINWRQMATSQLTNSTITTTTTTATTTLFLSFLITTILLLFIFVVVTLAICKCCCSNNNNNNNNNNKNKKNKKTLIQSREKEMANLIEHRDIVDSTAHNLAQHQHLQLQNYSHLTNDSSATLLSTNKMSNSIRMAYTNINEIYANHSLLTTTSSATASTYPTTHHIAIDTSGHNPKYHHLPAPHQTTADSYYDDLRFNNCDDSHHQLNYASPYRAQSSMSYSPIVRRDDPTVPLYATLKPKTAPSVQHQRQYTSNYVHDCDINYQTYKRIRRKPTKANLNKVVSGDRVANSSTTSLDDEDLDLNDLKDFEDVTFDNLRKPNEHNEVASSSRFKQHMHIKKSQLIMLQHGLKKNLLEHAQTSNNSQQSLLLKSSSSSSDKSSSNGNLNANQDWTNTNASHEDNTRVDCAHNHQAQLTTSNADKDKIYEETEI
ncbi:leucine-rich repeat-containing 24-like [Brachionus plicatilis]|uniref:Leucine-rich repeat-containing 24-like n=1 Tax=Brachionus plicatilis TaxID=10195 RepID=A0A3M7SGL0_BRAPC|nr:leucine-rich repeat-containing 24-like [Brachionus plicatilis]